ncbi:MAG: hypothetical protein R3E66_19395 [bacterium]
MALPQRRLLNCDTGYLPDPPSWPCALAAMHPFLEELVESRVIEADGEGLDRICGTNVETFGAYELALAWRWWRRASLGRLGRNTADGGRAQGRRNSACRGHGRRTQPRRSAWIANLRGRQTELVKQVLDRHSVTAANVEVTFEDIVAARSQGRENV